MMVIPGTSTDEQDRDIVVVVINRLLYNAAFISLSFVAVLFSSTNEVRCSLPPPSSLNPQPSTIKPKRYVKYLWVLVIRNLYVL